MLGLYFIRAHCKIFWENVLEGKYQHIYILIFANHHVDTAFAFSFSLLVLLLEGQIYYFYFAY